MIGFSDHHADWPEGDDGADGNDPEGGRPLTWEHDNVELLTVGIDIGSTTSHLVFARLHLRRLTQSLSSRYVVADREILHRSRVCLTPYQSDGLIDVQELDRFITGSYRDAGLIPDDVDTGAVILTGAALEKVNSRAVAELFAGSKGRFVCASAGHSLEAILAAHGAGAVALASETGQAVLHLDVGGGTTKLALCRDGEVVETAALSVGARVDGLDTAVMADAVLAAAQGGAPAGVMLTAPLHPPEPPAFVTCSGGVSEYVFARERERFGDRGPELAAELTRRFSFRPLREGIRATVIGASQFTVQVSGSTVHISRPTILPLRNLPVVSPRLPDGPPDASAVAHSIRRAFERMDLADGEGPVAIALRFAGEPHHASLRELAAGVVAALPQGAAGGPLVLALDVDLGRSLGRVLDEEFSVGADLIVIDGLDLTELDYVDVGEMIAPAGVVPVLIKSLAFPGPEPGSVRWRGIRRPGAPDRGPAPRTGGSPFATG